MESEYLSIEDANKIANHDKLLEKNTWLESDNFLLKEKLDKQRKEHQKVLEIKNKRIKELEEENRHLKYKQTDIFGG